MPLVSMRQLLDEAAGRGYLHLDHGNEPAACISAIDLGLTSVMMDGSLEADGKTPASFDYNVAVTKEVVAYAHARGATVEGELGRLGGIEEGHGSGEVHVTDPDEAVAFVEETGIEALAVAGAIRKVFAESPEKFDPRDYLKPPWEGMKALIAERMHDFGQAGQADDYESLSLEQICDGYAATAV